MDLINGIVVFLVSPINLVTTLLALSIIARLVLWRRTARAGFALSIAIFLAFAATPLAELIVKPLEDRFPRAEFDPDQIEGAIVLGGSTYYGEVARFRDDPLVSEGGERLLTAMALRHAHPDWTIILTGGGGANDPNRMSEEEITRQIFDSLGFDSNGFIFEGQSINTFENGALTRNLDLDFQQPWLLVTSAFHMPRAIAVFRAQGINVLPYPVDYLAIEPGTWPYRFDLESRFYWASRGLKEWVGLVSYYLLGRTTTLLP